MYDDTTSVFQQHNAILSKKVFDGTMEWHARLNDQTFVHDRNTDVCAHIQNELLSYLHDISKKCVCLLRSQARER